MKAPHGYLVIDLPRKPTDDEMRDLYRLLGKRPPPSLKRAAKAAREAAKRAARLEALKSNAKTTED